MAKDSKPKIDRPMQDKIGQELRAMYEELLRQPLPDKLTSALRALNDVQSSQESLNDAIEAPGPTARRTHQGGLSPRHRIA